MTLVPDEYVFAPATVAETSPIIHAHLPGASVSSDCFDAFVTVTHGPEEAVDHATAYAVARDLRGGSDVDRTVPADWHVRSLCPHLVLTGRGDHPLERQRIGTSIWFSRSYAVPEGYDESVLGNGDIEAPGIRPVR